MQIKEKNLISTLVKIIENNVIDKLFLLKIEWLLNIKKKLKKTVTYNIFPNNNIEI